MISYKVQQALNYSKDFGWIIIPVKPDKTPRIKFGNLNSTSSQDILKYADQWQNFDFGIMCDRRTGLVGLDIDDSAGVDTFLKLMEQNTHIDQDHLVWYTTSRGAHFLFEYDYSNPLKQLTDFMPTVVPHTDIRCTTGFVVPPPSFDRTWINSPYDVQIPYVPNYLLDLFQTHGVLTESTDTHIIGNSGDAVQENHPPINTVVLGGGFGTEQPVPSKLNSRGKHWKYILEKRMEEPIGIQTSTWFQFRNSAFLIYAIYPRAEARKRLFDWFSMTDGTNDSIMDKRLSKLNSMCDDLEHNIDAGRVIINDYSVQPFKPCEIKTTAQLEDEVLRLLNDNRVSYHAKRVYQLRDLAVYYLKCAKLSDNDGLFFRSYNDTIADIPHVFDSISDVNEKRKKVADLMGAITENFFEKPARLPIFKRTFRGDRTKEAPTGKASEYVVNEEYRYLLDMME